MVRSRLRNGSAAATSGRHGGGEQVSHLTRVGVRRYVFALHRRDLAAQQHLRHVPHERDDELSAKTLTLRTACTADGPVPYFFTRSILLTAVAVATAGLAIEGPLTFSPSAPRPSAR